MHIRKAGVQDADGIARVHVDCWNSSYKEILPDHILDNLSYADRKKRWQSNLPASTSGGSMTFVSEDSNKNITGFALGGTMRDPRLRIKYTGELYAVYVHPQYQGLGLGKQLFQSVAEHLASLHHSSIALWAFEEHEACSFSRHLGGEKVYDKKTTVGGKELNEWAYGWDNLEEILSCRRNLN